MMEPPSKTPLAMRLGNIYLPLLLSLVAAGTWTLYLGWVILLRAPLGFPVDESWVYQTLARNLAQSGYFSLNTDEPAAPFSPLWVILLSAGYRLPLDPRLWTYLLGLLFLAMTGWIMHRLTLTLFPGRWRLALAIGLGTVLEWHLAWSALSGLETAAFTFASLFILWLAARKQVSALLVGLMGGLAALIRPEGMVLLGLVLLIRPILAAAHERKGFHLLFLLQWLAFALPALVALAGTVLPYLIFVYRVTGAIIPGFPCFGDSAIIDMRLLARSASNGALGMAELLSGPLLMLMPGLIYASLQGLKGVLRVRRENLIAFLPVLWLLALFALHASAIYEGDHHRSELSPAIPLLVMFGAWGTACLFREHRPGRTLRAYTVTLTAAWLALWGGGAVFYGWDTRSTNYGAAVAQWVRENTPGDALIATDRPGAIGYFSGRRLVDLSGRVAPRLVSCPADEERTLAYLTAQQIDYLVIVPSRYLRIAADPRMQELLAPAGSAALSEGIIVLRARWWK